MSGFVIYRDLYYSTFTILGWQNLLEAEKNKKVVLDSFSFLSTNNYVNIYAFVIMSNHLHVLWQILSPHRIDTIVHSFKSYTANQLSVLLNEEQRESFRVKKADRETQIWKKGSLSVEITTPKFLEQKMNYIHDNPRRAGLRKDNIDYKYCSYKSYYNGKVEFNFLTLL